MVESEGQRVCSACGTVVEEGQIVASVEFSESGGGGTYVVGEMGHEARTGLRSAGARGMDELAR
jgi:transcription initiation factor TFIIIB Brf1 subunit/transcription initiation factor TFIIB